MKSIINGGNTNMKQLIQGLTAERKKQLQKTLQGLSEREIVRKYDK